MSRGGPGVPRATGEIVAVLRMGQSNAFYHLAPIAQATGVERLWAVRPAQPGPRLRSEAAIDYRQARAHPAPARIWSTYREAVRLGRRPEVTGFVSFNAFPYGLVALAAGRRCGKPVHVGFVGSDWYRFGRSRVGPLLTRAWRHADLVTVTGEGLREDLVACGYDGGRIHILPHGVDVERFTVRPPDERRFDAVFVGMFNPVKRLDLLLEALARVRDAHPRYQLALVGDGPCRPEVERLVEELGLRSNVTFAGFRADPSAWFSDARATVITSDREGFPFALVEGMCAGSVPVATTVGGIGSLLRDGEDSLLVPPGRVAPLAQALARLVEDRPLYDRLHAAALSHREELRLERVSELWSEWVRSLGIGEGPSGA